MWPLDQISLEETVVTLDAAVQALLRDRYSKEKDLIGALGEARQRSHTSGTPTTYYKQLISFVYSRDEADFDSILPFLDACDLMWPCSETVGPYDPLGETAVQSTQELLLLAIAEGSMHEYFKPHPEVEQWITQISDRVQAILRDHAGAADGGGSQLLPLLLGTAVVLHDLLGGLFPYFHRVRDKASKESSFVGHVISEIRRALLWTIIRDSEPEELRAGPETPLLGSDLLRHRVKLYALPARSEFRQVRLYLERLATDLEELEEISATMYGGLDLLPFLASVLRECPILGPFESEPLGVDKPLPFGQITLVWVYGAKDENTLYYTVDGVAHETYLAHSCPDRARGTDVEVVAPLSPTNGFTWKNVLTCLMDDRGKVYFDGIDRLAPPPKTAAYRAAAQVLARVEAACHHAMLQEWENYPDLFARLDILGSLVLVKTQSGTFLLCRADAVQKTQIFRSWVPQKEQETLALLDRIHMQVQGPWTSFVIERRPTATGEPQGADMRKVWRAKIRKIIEQERIPNFRRLVARLAPFGVEETTRGKGSHGTLRLQGKEERHQATWYAIRHEAEPLPIPYIWECLERLGISYQDFYKSLGGD